MTDIEIQANKRFKNLKFYMAEKTVSIINKISVVVPQYLNSNKVWPCTYIGAVLLFTEYSKKCQNDN